MTEGKNSLGYTAPYLMREEQLNSAVVEAQQKLADLQHEKANRDKWPRDMRLAIRLHDHLCQSRDCDFNYQFEKDGIREMNGIAAEPTQYRKMADRLLQYCEQHSCPIDELLSIINLRA